jgi:hypothetical protein
MVSLFLFPLWYNALPIKALYRKEEREKLYATVASDFLTLFYKYQRPLTLSSLAFQRGLALPFGLARQAIQPARKFVPCNIRTLYGLFSPS